MRYPSFLRTVARIIPVLALAHCLCAQPPTVPKEAQGLPPRATPADYQANAPAGKVTIAAEFSAHGIPTVQGALATEDYVVVEVGLFGAADSRLTIAITDFTLKINGKKNPLSSQPWGLVAKNVKDPEWVPPGPPVQKSKGSMGGSGTNQNDPPPSPPKVPVELLRTWQQRLQKSSLSEGDRALPQAGLLYFPYRGKAEGIRSVELTYEGPAGTATLALQ